MTGSVRIDKTLIAKHLKMDPRFQFIFSDFISPYESKKKAMFSSVSTVVENHRKVSFKIVQFWRVFENLKLAVKLVPDRSI